FLPSDRLWVLRNLTARVYIRADKFAIAEDCVRGPVIRGIGFGEVVLLKTWWSGKEYTPPGIRKGDWAGHCFDITPVEMLKGAEWKDVSDEVAVEIGNV
ncbi:F-box domain-containing protein, partial [Wilcoxina mikolae CBS 423.85]